MNEAVSTTREGAVRRGASRVGLYVVMALLVLVVLAQVQLAWSDAAVHHTRSELASVRTQLASDEWALSRLRIRAFVLEDRLEAMRALTGVRIEGSLEHSRIALMQRLEALDGRHTRS